MKTSTTLLLVFALAACVSAFERPFHTAVLDFLDERHDERMAQIVRDQGLPKDTLVAREHKEPPEWIVSGKAKFFSLILQGFFFLFLVFLFCFLFFVFLVFFLCVYVCFKH